MAWWHVLIQFIVTAFATGWQRMRQKQAHQEALGKQLEGDISIRPTDSANEMQVAFGLAAVQSVVVDAAGAPDWPGGGTGSPQYQRSQTIEKPADLGLITRRKGWTGAGQFDAGIDRKKDAVMVSREYFTANELHEHGELLLTSNDGEGDASTGRVAEYFGYLFAVPGVVPPAALLVRDKGDSEGGVYAPRWSSVDRGTKTSNMIGYHVNNINEQKFQPNAVPGKREVGLWGFAPKVVRTGSGTSTDPWAYDLERNADDSVRLSWCERNWTRVRLMQRLGPAIGAGFGEFGYAPEDLRLDTWWDEQEYDAIIVRGAGALDFVLETDEVDEGAIESVTPTLMFWTVAPAGADAPLAPDLLVDSAMPGNAAYQGPAGLDGEVLVRADGTDLQGQHKREWVWGENALPATGDVWYVLGRVSGSRDWLNDAGPLLYDRTDPPELPETPETFSNVQGTGNGFSTASIAGAKFPDLPVRRHMFNGVFSTGDDGFKLEEMMHLIKPGVVEYEDNDGKLRIGSPKAYKRKGSGWARAKASDFAVGAITDDSIVPGSLVKSDPDTTTRSNRAVGTLPDANLDFAKQTIGWPEKGSKFHSALLARDHGLDLVERIELRGVCDPYSGEALLRTAVLLSGTPTHKWQTDSASYHFCETDTVRLKSDRDKVDDFVFITRRRDQNGEEGLVVFFEGFLLRCPTFDHIPRPDETVTARDDLTLEVHPPTNGTATYDEATETIEIRWNAPAEGQVAYYEVQHRIDDGDWRATAWVSAETGTSATLNAALGNHDYDFQVRCVVVGKGESPWLAIDELNVVRLPRSAIRVETDAAGCPQVDGLAAGTPVYWFDGGRRREGTVDDWTTATAGEASGVAWRRDGRTLAKSGADSTIELGTGSDDAAARVPNWALFTGADEDGYLTSLTMNGASFALAKTGTFRLREPIVAVRGRRHRQGVLGFTLNRPANNPAGGLAVYRPTTGNRVLMPMPKRSDVFNVDDFARYPNPAFRQFDVNRTGTGAPTGAKAIFRGDNSQGEALHVATQSDFRIVVRFGDNVFAFVLDDQDMTQPYDISLPSGFAEAFGTGNAPNMDIAAVWVPDWEHGEDWGKAFDFVPDDVAFNPLTPNAVTAAMGSWLSRTVAGSGYVVALMDGARRCSADPLVPVLIDPDAPGEPGRNARPSVFGYSYLTSGALTATDGLYRFYKGGTIAAGSGTHAGNAWAEMLKASYIELGTLDNRGLPNLVLQDLTDHDWITFSPVNGQWATFDITAQPAAVPNGWRIPVELASSNGEGNVPPTSPVTFSFSRFRRAKPGHAKTYLYDFQDDTLDNEGVNGHYTFFKGGTGTANIVATGAGGFVGLVNATFLRVALRDENGRAALAWDKLRADEDATIVYHQADDQWAAFEVVSRDDAHSAGATLPYTTFGVRVMAYDASGGLDTPALQGSTSRLFQLSEFAPDAPGHVRVDLPHIPDKDEGVSQFEVTATLEGADSGPAVWDWIKSGTGISQIVWDKAGSAAESTATVSLANISADQQPSVSAQARVPSTGAFADDSRRFAYRAFDIELTRNPTVHNAASTTPVTFTGTFGNPGTVAEVALQQYDAASDAWGVVATASNWPSPYVEEYLPTIATTPATLRFRLRVRVKAGDDYDYSNEVTVGVYSTG